MNKNRVALGRMAQRIVRFHVMPTIETQTVGAHTFGVCLLLLELTNGNCSQELMKAALYHDVPEAVVGDIPSPTLRKFPKLKEEYKAAEEIVCIEYGMQPTLTAEEARLLHLADRLELVLFAVEDHWRGNTHALGMAQRCLDSTYKDLVDISNATEKEVYTYVQERYYEAASGVRNPSDRWV